MSPLSPGASKAGGVGSEQENSEQLQPQVPNMQTQPRSAVCQISGKHFTGSGTGEDPGLLSQRPRPRADASAVLSTLKHADGTFPFPDFSPVLGEPVRFCHRLGLL